MLRIISKLQSAEAGQDRLLVLESGAYTIVAVADGAGGISGGAEAADLAIKVITLEAATLTTQAACVELLEEIDHGIVAEDAGETTCVLAVIGPEGIFGASVGDSGAWMIHGNEIDPLTSGQYIKPFLGSGAAIVAGFARDAFNGVLLIATDGLLKYTSRETIAGTVEKTALEDLPDALIQLVRYPSGALPDDVALIACRKD